MHFWDLHNRFNLYLRWSEPLMLWLRVKISKTGFGNFEQFFDKFWQILNRNFNNLNDNLTHFVVSKLTISRNEQTLIEKLLKILAKLSYLPHFPHRFLLALLKSSYFFILSSTSVFHFSSRSRLLVFFSRTFHPIHF